MPRKQIPISRIFPYHISARCINKEWFDIPMNDVWSIMGNYLHFIQTAYEIKIISFVLMSNHFHLIVSNPLGNLSEAMNYFMRETSRQIGRESGRINQIYGARFHRSLIMSERYLYHAYKYVYRNPVRAGLSDQVEDYSFSTLNGLLGLSKIIIPIEGDSILFAEKSVNVQVLDWLNRCPTPEFDRQIQLALRRREYALPKNKNSKCVSPLEDISWY